MIGAALLAAPTVGIFIPTGWVEIGVALVAAIVGAGGIATILNLPKNRRKLDAETSEIITGAAIALVKPLQDQVTALTARVTDLEGHKAAQHALLVTHAAWDSLVVDELRKAGAVTTIAPPLHLPAYYD